MTTAVTVTVCRTRECRAEVRMVEMDTGRVMPVDVEPNDEGNMTLIRTPAGWRMHVLKAGEQPTDDPRRWMSHFATCKRPQDHRKPALTVLTGGDAGDAAAAALEAGGLAPSRIGVAGRAFAPRPVTIGAPGPAGPVSVEQLPELDQLGAGLVDADRTCARCGMVCAAALPALEDGGPLVLLERAGGLYDHLAVLAADRWRVRPVGDTEQRLPISNRVMAHACRPHHVDPGRAPRCQGPVHGANPPAGALSAGGVFCDACRTNR